MSSTIVERIANDGTREFDIKVRIHVERLDCSLAEYAAMLRELSKDTTNASIEYLLGKLASIIEHA